MTSTPLEALLEIARGPAGPAVEVDFDRPEPAYRELASLLRTSNGLALFNAGIQVFRAGEVGIGPELGQWNDAETWKSTYDHLSLDLFCFAQDVVGVQFGIDGAGQVVGFDPETAERTVLGESLQDWAAWLLSDPANNGAGALATRWQDTHGPLGHDERLIPRQFFVLGGGYELANLMAIDSAQAMRIRGPIARRIHELPDGAQLRLQVD